MSIKKYGILSLLLMSTAWAAGTQQPFYDYLNEVLLKDAPPKVKPKKPAPNDSILPAKVHPEDLVVKTVKEIEQKLLFVQLLQDAHPDKTFSTVLDKASMESLELVNRGEQFAALSRKFGVQTIFGQIMLPSMLSCPLTEFAAIQKRQAFVRQIGENQQTAAIIQQTLEDVRKGQERLLTFFDENSAIDETLLKKVYGPFGKSLPAILTYKTIDRFGVAYGLFTPLATGLTIINNYSVMKKFLYTDDKLTQTEKRDLATGIMFGLNWTALKNAPKKLLDWHNPGKMLEGTGPSFANKAGWLTFGCARALAYDAFIVWSYYSRIQNEKVTEAILENMQNRLMGVAQVVKGLKRINDLMQKEPTIAQIPELAPITALFGQQNSSGLKKLVELLQTRTFEGQPSYFSNSLHILRAYKLMGDHKQELVPALEAIGVFDNFAAAANLVSHSRAGAYCYATILDEQLPVINLRKFWNPLLASDQAVPNDVTLGAHGNANMIITGPNGSGKSTNMKAIALNVLLAQTFGIAAAEQACITPFNKICTYINVQENIQDGMSTFMAEAQRLEEIDHAITSIAPNSRCLTLIDEGMRGTVASEGVKRLCDVCKRIGAVPQSVCIIATHFEEPTQLQEQTHGQWTNYYVEIDEPTPGNFVRLYTLKRGVNSAWFTNDQSRKRFVDWLVKTTAK